MTPPAGGPGVLVWARTGAAVSLAVALALFDPYLFTGGDNVTYYALARALATGRGYVDLIAPGSPIETVYPPGFPLLLVPFYWLFGGSLVAMKLQSWLMAGVALWATYRLARADRGVPPWAGAAAVWVVGLSPVFLLYTRWVLSDMSFTAVSLVALYAFAHAGVGRETHENGSGRTGWWIVGCLLALFAFAIRTAGVTLLVAALATALLHRRWRRAGIVAATAVVGAIPWLVWTAQRPPTTGGYLQQATASNRLNPESAPIPLEKVIRRGLENLGHYASVDLPQLFWPSPDVPLLVVVLGLLAGVGLIGYGAWRLVRTRGLAVWDLHVLFTIGVLVIWPWTGDRFFLSIVPLLWLAMLTGLDAASRFMTSRVWPAQVAVGLLAAFLFAGALRQAPAQWALMRTWLDGDELAGYAPFWRDYFAAAEWIGVTAPDAVIAARKPSFAWYWSDGRPSLVYPFHGDPDRTWRFLRRHQATHLILDPVTRDFLGPVLAPYVDQLEVVHAAPGRLVYVLRIVPEAR